MGSKASLSILIALQQARLGRDIHLLIINGFVVNAITAVMLGGIFG